MHATCSILGLGYDKLNLSTLKLVFDKHDSLWVRPRTCTPAILQSTRAIGEYYFWYNQILAPLPGNWCFVKINFVVRLILSFY
jgi:hypothetical protein